MLFPSLPVWNILVFRFFTWVEFAAGDEAALESSDAIETRDFKHDRKRNFLPQLGVFAFAVGEAFFVSRLRGLVYAAGREKKRKKHTEHERCSFG